MTCRAIVDSEGRAIGFACSRGPKTTKCGCGRNAVFLCDYLVPIKTGTFIACDKPLCKACAIDAGRDRHYCGPHYSREQTSKLLLDKE